MNNQTWIRRLSEMIVDLEDHPYKEEIIKLAEQQLADDFEQRPYPPLTAYFS